jgi:hypothetical protein
LHIGRARIELLPVNIKDDTPDYLETAIMTRDFQATLPHDKILSLWNISKDKEGLE